ncbi:MAG: hypothetical protein ACI8P9_002407 [Parasphingorhabdus sp.]|jgi:hypothetical protein
MTANSRHCVASVLAAMALLFASIGTNAVAMAEVKRYAATDLFADDGIPLVTPFRIRSVAAGKYLQQSDRGVVLAPLIENDDSFNWVLDGKAIASLANGLYLFQPTGTSYVWLRGSMGTKFSKWDISIAACRSREVDPDCSTQPIANTVTAEEILSYPRDRIYMLHYDATAKAGRDDTLAGGRDGSVLLKERFTSDWSHEESFHWQFEPAPKRDLVKITIKSVKAVQTSTGTDGATDALFKAIEVTAEWGPTILSSPVGLGLKKGMASLVAKVTKTGAKAGVRRAASKSLKQVVKELSGKIGTHLVNAPKLAKRAVQDKILNYSLKTSEFLVKGQDKLRKIARASADLRHSKGLGEAISKLKRFADSSGQVASSATAMEKLEEAFEMAKDVRKNVKKVEGYYDKGNSAFGEIERAGNVVVAAAADLFVSWQRPSVSAQDLDWLNAALRTTAVVEILESDAYHEDAVNCTRYKYNSTAGYSIDRNSWRINVPARDVMTPQRLSEFSARANALSEALEAAGASDASEEVGQIVLDTVLMSPGWLENLLSPLIEDTDDALELRLHSVSVWPNGGNDHREISKGEEKDVNVEFIFDRQKGVNLMFIEYDYGSDDDDLGHLTFATSDLRYHEYYQSAFIRSKSEGSLYAVNFAIDRITPGWTRQQLQNFEYGRACERKKKFDRHAAHVLAKMEQAERITAAVERVRVKIDAEFGTVGLAAYDASMHWSRTLDATCTSEIDRADVVGDWRVGVFDDAALLDRDTTWAYSFLENGTFVTPNGWGNWRLGPRLKTGQLLDIAVIKDGSSPWRRVRSDIDVYIEGAYHIYDVKPEEGPVGLVTGNTITWRRHQQSPSGGKWWYDVAKWTRRVEPATSADVSGIWFGPDGKIFRIKRNQEQITIHQVEQMTACGIYLTAYNSPHYLDLQGLELIGGGMSFAHVRADTSGLYMFRYADDAPPWGGALQKHVNAFSAESGNYRDPRERIVDAYRGVNYRVTIGDRFIDSEYDVHPLHVRAEGGGPGQWLQKIQPDIENSGESPESVDLASTELIGSWTGGSYADPYWGHHWIFSSDHIVVGGPGRTLQGDPVVGSWRYLGDRRFAVKTDSKDSGSAEYTLYLGLAAPPKVSPATRLHATLRDKTHDGRGSRYGHSATKSSSSLLYASLPPEIQYALELARQLHGRAVPEDERKANPVSLTELREQRELEREAARVAELEQLAKTLTPAPLELRVANRNQQVVVLGNLLYNGVCAITDMRNDENLVGEWRVGIYDRQGHRLELPAGDRKWIFDAGGSLSGNIESAPWTASWKAVPVEYTGPTSRHTGFNYCSARIEFDATTARYYEIARDAEIRMVFHENGDKEFFITGVDEVPSTEFAYSAKATERLLIWGIQESDKSVYSYHYDQLVLTPAQIANRCSSGIGGGTGSIGGQAIDVQISSWISGDVDVYKVDFDGSEASLLGTVRHGQTGSFPGIRGDEFALLVKVLPTRDIYPLGYFDASDLYRKLGQDNRCIGVVTTDQSVAESRVEHEFGSGSAVSTVNFEQMLSEAQIANGCSGHPRISSGNLGEPGQVRNFTNTGQLPISVYKVEVTGVGGGTSGAYVDPNPVLELAPGQSAQLEDSEHRKYTVLDSEEKCVAVVEIDDQRPYGHLVGDGSTPIEDPTVLLPEQVLNGCMELGMVRSELSTRIPTAVTGRIVNTGQRRLQVYWIGYDGEYDLARPSLAIEPGEAATLFDYMGAYYTVLAENGRDPADQRCVAVFEMRYGDNINDRQLTGDPALYRFADVEEPAVYGYAERHVVQPAGVYPPPDLNSFQLSGGCDRYGLVASRPSWQRQSVKLWNAGQTDLNVHWVSFYGADMNGEEQRLLAPRAALKAGKVLEFEGAAGDFYSVVDRDGACVAVVDLSNNEKHFYELRDSASADEFDRNNAALKQQEVAMLEKLGGLNEAVENSICKVGAEHLDIYGLMKGSWELEFYEFDDNQDPLYESSSFIWRFDEHGAVTGSTPNGPFSGYLYRDNGCEFRLQGQIYNFVQDVAGVSEFFRPRQVWVDRDANSLRIDTYTLDTLEIYARRISNHIDEAVDTDESADRVDEGVATGTSVGITVFAVDRDMGDTVSYRLLDDAGGLFAIDAVSGVVMVAGTLDRETHSEFSIVAGADSSDGSGTTRSFEISLDDVSESDVSEIIETGDDDNIVDENRAVGTAVGIIVVADDDDIGDSVSLSLSDDAGGRFKIFNGVVTAAEPLDYESASSHTIEITATSTDGSSRTRGFVIEVRDQNEFSVDELRDSDDGDNIVDENSAVGTAVGIIAFARDADGSHNTISYSLSNDYGYGAHALEMFAIDPASGEITVAGALDREQVGDYIIEVTAASVDGSSIREQFELSVGDVNEFDVGEVVDIDDDPNTVGEDAAVGTPVGVTVQAEDSDISNNFVVYAIGDIDGNDLADGPFTVDIESGVISVSDNSQLDIEYEANPVVYVLARSEDGSSSNHAFIISLIDTNEFAVGELFDSDDSADQLDEDAGAGMPVGITLLATDSDASDTVSYWLSDDADGLFEVDDAGVVRLVGVLDREQSSSQSITAYATSSDESSSETRVFTIEVNNVNEFEVDGVIDGDESPDEIDEDAAIGTPVGVTAFAHDEDIDDTVSYNLTDDAGGLFEIDSVSGVVTLARDGLDFETLTIHSIEYTAISSDGSTSPWTMESFIAVSDVDEFDVGLVSDIDDRPNTVDEDSAAGTETGLQASATDADGSYNVVYYEIVDDAGASLFDGPFTIDGISGRVSVGLYDQLDYEIDPSPVVRVRAISEDRSSTVQEFVIDLVDVEELGDVPTDPRTEKDYSKVPDADWYACEDASEDMGSLSYDNVEAFYDCLDNRLVALDAMAPDPEASPPPDPEAPPPPNLSAAQIANGCEKHGVIVSTPKGREAEVSLTNTGSADLHIFWISQTGADVNFDEEPVPIMTLVAGDNLELNTDRGFVFSVLDDAGKCVGIMKIWESREDFSFAAE